MLSTVKVQPRIKDKNKPPKAPLVTKYYFDIGFDSAEYYKNKAIEQSLPMRYSEEDSRSDSQNS